MAIISTRLTTGNVAATAYTSVANSAITTVYICNTSTTATSANVYAVPTGQTAGPINQIYTSLRVAGHDTYVMEAERLLFVNGDSLQVEASTDDSITVTVSYTGI